MADKQKKSEIASRFRNINIIFLIITLIIVIVLSAVMLLSISDEASKKYAGFYSVETVEILGSQLNREIGYVQYASQSKEMIDWFDDEDNIEKKAAAHREMMKYADTLQIKSLYFVIMDSLNEYSVESGARFEDFVFFNVLDPSNLYDLWFFDCIDSENEYTLWMDVDKITNTRRLWINYKVMDNGVIRGVFCSALQLDDIFNELFGRYDSSSVMGLIIDQNGYIKMDSSVSEPQLFYDGVTLSDAQETRHILDINKNPGFISTMKIYLENSGSNYKELIVEPKIIRLWGSPFSYLSIAPIPNTNWSAVTLYNSRYLFSVTRLLPPLLVILSVFVLYVAANSELIRRLVFKPLNRLTNSVFKAGFDGGEIYGAGRSDEIGELARTTQKTMTEIIRLRTDLEKALKESQAANQAKTAFLANMSHEIRTPLNSIMGFSELAVDGEASLKTKDYLKKIFENAEWLLRIINDILDISKVESGKMELEEISFDIHELLAICKSLIMPKAAEKGIALHCYIQPDTDKMLLGDPTRLRQVFLNLLSNAVKFTNAGTVELIAKAKDRNEKTVTICFEIKDTGIGMSENQIKKVFEPFTQAETGTTRKYGGTGLGLAITKNIVELMGGQLSVESAPGAGSKFSFELTFEVINTPDNDLPENKTSLYKLEKPAFEGEILLCEDNAMNRQVICEHLARVGLETVVAENGKIGVELVQSRIEKGEKQFDLIFMDMHMPVMDGFEASAKIIAFNTGVPIVALTANVMSHDREIYKTYGINDCLGKPFSSQELWRCLMKYFTPVSTGDANKDAEDSPPEADLKFRQKLQLMFIKGNQNKYEEIVKAIEEGDIKLAHRLAHTLKSNAGQIGITSLQQAAGDVEGSLNDGKNNVTTQQMALLKTELDAALAQISPLLESLQNTPRTGDDSPLDGQAAFELLEKLEPMLKTGNSECLRLTDSLRRIPESEELVQHIEDYDFELASSTFKALKKKMGIV